MSEVSVTVNLRDFDLANPTSEHAMLRETVQAFVKSEVEPQLMSMIKKKDSTFRCLEN